MGLSSYIEQIIEQNYATIISDVSFKDILIDLRSTHILSDDEVEELQQLNSDKGRGFKVIRILKSRDNKDFFEFCKILKDSQILNIQNLGLKLEKETKEKGQANGLKLEKEAKEKGQANESLLRDLPLTPESGYVLRKQLNDTICNQLKQIDRFGGHILVHGMPGSGKTVAVCQAVRQLIIQENYFKPYGCYWIKIGDISEQQLLATLRSLASLIGVENTESIQSLVEINSKIKQYFQRNTEISDLLFIFDDIWNQDYYNYLAFTKKSIVTSRFNHIRNINTYYNISATENLTDDEAIQVLIKRRNKDNNYKITNNSLVKDAIHNCKGLPSAISLIGDLNLQSDEEWLDVIKSSIEKMHNPISPLANSFTCKYPYRKTTPFRLLKNKDPNGSVIELDDNSIWKVGGEKSEFAVTQWSRNDVLIIYPRAFSSYFNTRFLIRNTNKQTSANVDISMGPTIGGPYNTQIVNTAYDHPYEAVDIRDGRGNRSVCHIDPSDCRLLPGWRAGQSIILGSNLNCFSQLTSTCSYILLNVEMNEYVRANIL